MELGLGTRRFLVVGASGGIGHAVCRALVAEGVAGIAMGARDVSKARAQATELAQRGTARLEVVQCDLTARFDAEAFVAAAEQAIGPLDGVVMCAGNPPWGGLWDVGDPDWDLAVTSMLMGPVRVLRALLPRLTARGWGRVVLVGGLNGRQPAGASVIAGVVCAGLASLATAIAKDAVAAGVTVNVVDPHVTDTARWRRRVELSSEQLGLTPEQAQAQLLSSVPRGRPVPPEDVADAITYLLSDRAASIAGTALAVDGAVASGLY